MSIVASPAASIRMVSLTGLGETDTPLSSTSPATDVTVVPNCSLNHGVFRCAVLTVKQTDSRPVAQMLQPIARAELARRRQAKASAGDQFSRSA